MKSIAATVTGSRVSREPKEMPVRFVKAVRTALSDCTATWMDRRECC